MQTRMKYGLAAGAALAVLAAAPAIGAGGQPGPDAPIKDPETVVVAPPGPAQPPADAPIKDPETVVVAPPGPAQPPPADTDD